MNFKEFLKDNIVVLDGGMGTLLQKRGLRAGEKPEEWNITHPDEIAAIHREYFDAGSNVVCTNTFGANILKFSKDRLEEIISAAIYNAKKARAESSSGQEKFIALDIGPTGKLLSPLGELDFEEAVEIFAETVRLGAKNGADLVVVETMNDSYETKAAVLAVKENCSLPLIVTNAYGEDAALMTGASPEAMAVMLEGLGVDALGANCSLGPKQLTSVAERLLAVSSVPVVMKPNAGLPRVEDGKTLFDVLPEEFSCDLADLVKKGVRALGGCCGTTPEYIKRLTEKLLGVTPKPCEKKNLTAVSSYSHAVFFKDSPILIGERINPTGKKLVKKALIENDVGYLLSEGVRQAEKGVQVLDVNVGLPDIDEKEMLPRVVCELQATLDLPLQIDTSNPEAMERALRRYNGKAMINSTSGKRESMEKIFPLVKKYGGVVVALTLDENGIPDSAEGRVKIAEKILDFAREYGIDKKDIVFDTLAMTVSADTSAALHTLGALRRIKNELHTHTSLGVSNVSFGLPERDAVNSAFFAMALEGGLSAAIMNPYSSDMMKTYYAWRVLHSLDENCSDYILHAPEFATKPAGETPAIRVSAGEADSLQEAVVRGWRERAGQLAEQMLETRDPLEIVNFEIIPALNLVGEGFEKKTLFLPQLLMSAEAAKCAFEKIKEKVPAAEKSGKTFVLATVKGDIHDIGKNIVKLLLENYGVRVIDLGRDVESEKIVEAVVETGAEFVGLSALMTTTVPAMEETIKLLREKAPLCKIIVGGAVLTEEYAEKIGADKYARDAMEAVRYIGK